MDLASSIEEIEEFDSDTELVGQDAYRADFIGDLSYSVHDFDGESSSSTESNREQCVLESLIDAARSVKEANRLKTLDSVESLIMDQLFMFSNEQTCSNASFIFPTIGLWDNVKLDPEQGLVPESADNLRLTFVSFGNSSSRPKYVRIMLVLNKIHQLLVDDERITKRELYYQLISQGGGNQGQIDDAVNAITACLQTPRSHLRILSTSKGLIAGKFVYVDIYGNEVDCSMAKQGQTIPNDVDDIVAIKTNATLVIIVEKDATFQRLMDEDFLELVNEDVVVITGKGFPDIGTRKLLRRLAFELLPDASYWALVDSDPHGIEIMSVYTFGSAALAWTGEPLSVPMLEWIGVRPKEMPNLEPDVLKPLNDRDLDKLASLLSRNYFSQDIIEELEMIAYMRVKAEIEDIDSPSRYLYNKINQL